MNDKLRIETAVEMLNDRFPYRVGELYMRIDEKGYLNITMASVSGDLNSISKSNVLQELEEIKRLFNKMKVASINFKTFTESKRVKYNLDFDYGMGDIRICSEFNGLIDWQMDLF